MILILALTLALISAVAYAAGAVVQQRLAASGSPAGRGRWLAALALNGAGAALHVLALRYGPLSLIQPLGALTLVLALPAGAALNRRRLGTGEWHGIALTMAGLAGLLLLTRNAGPAHAIGGTAIAWTVAASVTVLAALAAGSTAVTSPARRSLLHATASGVAFGVSSALTQTAAVQLAEGGAAALLTPAVCATLIAITGFAVAGLSFTQAAYRGGLGAQLATSTLINAAAAAAIGIAVLGERFAAGSAGAVLAVTAAALAARGVLMLSQPAAAGPRQPRGAAESSDPVAVGMMGR